MGEAWIDGNAVDAAAAIDAAARLLAASRLPVIAGVGTDVAGARAAIALAQRIGGVVDHNAAARALCDLDAMREAGMMVTTANEARLRAEVLLLAGTGLSYRPQLAQRLLAPPSAIEIGPPVTRRVIWLCPEGRKLPTSGAQVHVVGRSVADLPIVLAALRARLAGRPVGSRPLTARKLNAIVADLKTARFGVAVWGAGEFDALTIEMLSGLIDDLNAHTRFSGLSLPPLENALGVMQVCGWMTGFPLPIAFARGHAEHDPWRFDSNRLIASGEADCAIWMSSYIAALPPWAGRVPTIVVMCRSPLLPPGPGIHIQVGAPGVDHDAVEYCDDTGTLAPVAATRPSEAMSVAQALSGIAAALPEARVPC
jgi:formylmethanofuran dehydrogenase subunit B